MLDEEITLHQRNSNQHITENSDIHYNKFLNIVLDQHDNKNNDIEMFSHQLG
jgi:hypothetical protein